MGTRNLSVATFALDGGCLVQLAGTIDETTDAAALLFGTAEVVVFDLDGVRRITSYGVLQWVKALKELRARYYAFMRCRPAIVRQFNMVAGFGKHGELLSIFLPYFCESCDQEFETLLDLRSDYALAQSAAPPEASCPSCARAAEFDDVPKNYLAFALEYPRPNPPELAMRLVAEATRRVVPASSPSPSLRPAVWPSHPPSADVGFARSDSRTFSAVPAPRDAPLRDAVPRESGAMGTSEPEPRGASLDHFRKLQDELDVTRDRLSRMIKERKPKS